MTNLNLLSETFQRRRMIRHRLAQWAAVLTSVIAVVAGLVWQQQATRRNRKQYKDEIEVRYEPIVNLQRETTQLKQQLVALQSRESITLSLAEEKPILALLGLVGQATNNSNHQVFVQRFDFKKGETGRDGPSRNRLTLNGVGLNNLAIAQFAAKLRDTGLFARVELSSTQATEVEALAVRSFRVECIF